MLPSERVSHPCRRNDGPLWESEDLGRPSGLCDQMSAQFRFRDDKVEDRGKVKQDGVGAGRRRLGGRGCWGSCVECGGRRRAARKGREGGGDAPFWDLVHHSRSQRRIKHGCGQAGETLVPSSKLCKSAPGQLTVKDCDEFRRVLSRLLFEELPRSGHAAELVAGIGRGAQGLNRDCSPAQAIRLYIRCWATFGESVGSRVVASTFNSHPTRQPRRERLAPR